MIKEGKIHFETRMKIQNKIYREINKHLQREMDRILHGFSWDKVEMTKREKSNRITAREFLQL